MYALTEIRAFFEELVIEEVNVEFLDRMIEQGGVNFFAVQ